MRTTRYIDPFASSVEIETLQKPLCHTYSTFDRSKHIYSITGYEQQTTGKKKPLRTEAFFKRFGGGAGIRTLGRLQTYVGFQDRCIRPLCHPSEERESYRKADNSQWYKA